MDDRTLTGLRFVASQLAFVVGLLHVGLGAVNWLRWVGAGFLVPRDLRWPVFVASGLAVLVGIYRSREAADRRPYYAAGVVAMLGYAVGYFAWHLSGHRPLLLLGPGAATETVTVGWFLDHLFAGPVETVAVFAELFAAAALLALLLADRPSRTAG
ncbi:MAG: hypothetical protein U5J98_09725 [Halobacteriales archaeon]|nr:hypothetical protein [Halobacteriales archaeon]